MILIDHNTECSHVTITKKIKSIIIISLLYIPATTIYMLYSQYVHEINLFVDLFSVRQNRFLSFVVAYAVISVPSFHKPMKKEVIVHLALMIICNEIFQTMKRFVRTLACYMFIN